jgi:hypothetical protein
MAKSADKGGKPNAKKEGSGLSIKEKRKLKEEKRKAKTQA